MTWPHDAQQFGNQVSEVLEELLVTLAVPHVARAVAVGIEACERRRKKAKIFAKLIINKNDFIHTEDSQEVRYMDEKYLFPGEITIYGDKVAMFIFEKNHYEAIIIDSPTFTQMVQGIFNFTWDMLGQSIEKK
jgi:hypothetical protein